MHICVCVCLCIVCSPCILEASGTALPDAVSKEAFVEVTNGCKMNMKVGGDGVGWRGEVKFEGGNV